MEEQKQQITQDYIITRLKDWKNRLDKLFADVEQWCNDLPEDQHKEILRGSMLQGEEELMEKFDVQPGMVPTIAVLYGRNRVSFVPAALWVIAANGRVNVTTNEDQYILVDLGGKEGSPSEWIIADPTNRSVRYPFNKETFWNLVVQQALKAA